MDATTLATLTATVGPDNVLVGKAAAAYAVDGFAPSIAVLPPTPEAVAAVLALAARAGLSVIPWGAGTGMALGNLPRRYDLALILTRLDRVLEYEPADLTVTVQAGTPLARLQEVLAERGQFLPLDPPGAGRATIGGILARNVTGPRRTAYGAPRDLLLGCRAALPDGTVVHAGGKVVKNVAGYDLNRLFTGALGTLGVFVEATFKVLPLPAASATVMVALPTLEEAIARAHHLRAARIPLLALEALDVMAVASLAATGETALPAGQAALLIEVGGVAAAVDRQLRDLSALAADRPVAQVLDPEQQARLWTAVCDLGMEGSRRTALALRAAVLPAQTAEAARLIAEASPGSRPLVRARPGAGTVEAFWHDAGAPAAIAGSVQELMRLVGARGGSLVVTAAPPAVKARLDVWGVPPPSFPLMQRVKAQFDSAGVLNPGRFVGGL